MRRPLRIYRLLLWLYPAGFRDEYNAPLQRQFKDDYAELRGRRDRARFWLATAVDLLRSAPPQFLRELRQDSAHTVRLWRRNPWPTLFAVVVLAIAIGANTGVFSVLNALVLRSLPFREPERLAVLNHVAVPFNDFHTWRGRTPYLSDAATYDTIDVNLDGGHIAGRMRLTEASWSFFAVLGTEAVVGRTFAPGEDVAGANAVAVLGHAVWQQLFGANPRIVGSTIHVNGTALTVIGVAPPGFDYPQKTDLWSPTALDFRRIPKTGTALFFYTIGRLKPGWSWTQANQAAQAEAARTAPPGKPIAEADRASVRPLQQELAGPVRRASLILMAGVGLLLLLACANIANLLLARTLTRSHELMIRTALGASRGRLTQQLLTETILLSLVAMLAGLIVAVWTTTVAAAAQPPQISSQSYTLLDARVLAFTAGLSLLTGVLFGAGPVWFVTRGDVSSHARQSTGTASRSHSRSALIAIQVAITIVLLTGSIALGRTFISLLRTDLGYELESIATMNVSIAGSTHAMAGRSTAYYDDVLRRVRALPGVLAVSMTDSLPLAIEGVPATAFQLDHRGPASPLTSMASVSPGYFSTMGSSVVAGREFTSADLTSGEAVAIVNEEFGQSFGGASAVLGRSATADGWPTARIVGVTRGMRIAGPAFEPRPQIFYLSKGPRAATIVVKVVGPARNRLAMIRDTVQSIDPRVPVFNVKTMDQRLADTVARPRFYTTAIVFFGGLALLLAVVGIYGTVSYAVVQRTREMGVRLALGTTPARLRATLLRQTLAIVTAGALVGVAGAVDAGRYLQSLVEGADGAIALTSTLAVIATLVVAALAIWRATRHIARLDVADVLRSGTQ